jgi:hypothetical protein
MPENTDYKTLEVRDVFFPENIAIFTRPKEQDNVVIIAVEQPGKFYLTAATLQSIGNVLAK